MIFYCALCPFPFCPASVPKHIRNTWQSACKSRPEGLPLQKVIVGEVKRQAKEIETLKKENYNLSFKNQNLEGQLRTNNIEMRRVQETTDRQIKAEASKLKPITNLFPEMENAQENIEELQTMGIQNKDIRQLLIGKEIYYTGNLYDKDKRKSYQVKNVKIDISKSQNGITTIWLNNIHFKNFLKELWNTLQKTLDNGNWLHR